MILPRNLGFIVRNLISEGDWCSLRCNPGLQEKQKLEEYRNAYDVKLLEQVDGFSGVFEDHFFQSRTYQEVIKDNCVRDYRDYGELK